MRQPARLFPVFFAALALALIVATTLRAQTVRWEPGSGQLGYNQVSELSLVFENCEPEPDGLRVPEVDGLIFGRPSAGTNRSISVVNGSVQNNFTYTLTYPVRPTKRANLTIPPFSVQTDKGSLRVAGAKFSVGDATVGNSGLSVDEIAAANLDLPKKTFWAGEVFPVTYQLSVIKRYFHSPATLVEWQASPLVLEEWSKPEPSETMIKGERRFLVTQATRAYAKAPGQLSLKPAQQVVNLNVGTVGFGLFAQQSVEQRILATPALDLTIKPLPAAPADFSGAVGQFSLVAKVVPTSPAVGEPVTWTLELAGTGNWPDLSGLPQREVSSDFSVVQPKSKRTMKGNSLFEGALTEDVVLVPTKPGRYTLAPVKFTYFDTTSGTYKTITTEPVTLNVAAGNAAPAAAQPSGPVQFSLNPAGNAPSAAPSAASAIKLPDPVAPAVPDQLPRDPLRAPAHGFAPRAVSSLFWLGLATTIALPLALWLWFAAQLSRERDPQRRRREAHTALRQLVAQIRGGSDTIAALKAWQQHTATLWEIRHAAPGAPLVERFAQAHGTTAAPQWATLWAEADRAQHGRDGQLPADWTQRADQALDAVAVPGWPALTLFAPRHLFPFLFAAAVLLAAPLSARAEAVDDYTRGNYAAAQAAWQKTLAAAPTDWAARHNLGLAYAQQDRWAEATAQWTSAFLLQPRAELTRIDLALGLQHSGIATPELVSLARGEGRYGIARLASPGEWQLALLVSAALLCAALVLLLCRLYGKTGLWSGAVALVAMLLAITLASTATFGLHTYGQLAEPNAVIVWRASTLRSIPTEADTQKTTALSAGSIAVVDKTFLGWSRLNFPGGQVGWARTDDLTALYR